jgi:parvulin-like peptidyl-prolyl isomerase
VSGNKKGGGKTVKFCKGIILCILFVVITATAALTEVTDKIIVVVNDEIITQKDLAEVLEPYLKKIEENYQGNDKEGIIKQTRDAILQRLIDNILIEHEAKKIGASIKDNEVMEVLKETLEKQNIKMEDFLKKLASDGNSLASVKNEIKGQLMRMRLMHLEIKSKIMISDQEIGDYYNQHRDEYEGKEAVRIKQILLLLPPGADKATRSNIREKAEQIQKKALNGESFEGLAAQYSQGREADQGGDVGFIEKGGIIPEVETAAFSLSPGQVSSVIQSSLGFHIIKVVDNRGAGLKPIATVREEIKAKLEDGKLEKKFEEWITALRKKSHIEMK